MVEVFVCVARFLDSNLLSLNTMKITVSVAEMRDQLNFLLEFSELLKSHMLSNILFHTYAFASNSS